MPYFIGMGLYTIIKWAVGFFGKKIAFFLIYSGLLIALTLGFFVSINTILETVSNNIGLGFTDLNAMLPTGLTSVMSFYFSSRAVMWAFLAQYKFMAMKGVFLR